MKGSLIRMVLVFVSLVTVMFLMNRTGKRYSAVAKNANGFPATMSGWLWTVAFVALTGGTGILAGWMLVLLARQYYWWKAGGKLWNGPPSPKRLATLLLLVLLTWSARSAWYRLKARSSTVSSDATNENESQGKVSAHSFRIPVFLKDAASFAVTLIALAYVVYLYLHGA